MGYGTEALAGNQENTDVARFLAGLMGEDDFGEASEVTPIVDMTDKDTLSAIVDRLEDGKDATKITDEGLRVSFGDGINRLVIPADIFEVEDDALGKATAFRVTYTNMGTEKRMMPYFVIRQGESQTTIGEKIVYLAPGQTYTHTYVIPAAERHASVVSGADDVVLYTRAAGDIDVVISDISVVTRDLLK